MKELTQKDRDDAEAKATGKVYEAMVEMESETVYTLFEKPKRGEYYNLLDKLSPKDAKTFQIMKAHETFVKSCTLFPSQEELTRLFEEHYNLAAELSNEAVKVAVGKARETTSGR